MERITDKHLEEKIAYLNKITGSPAEPYTLEGGKLKANIGNFHLSHAYGGVCLHRMFNEAGGVSSTLSTGHITKRELSGLIAAYIRGIEGNGGAV